MTLGKHKYAYSFDDVEYKGYFNARSQARRAAIEEMQEAGQADGVFYIGKLTSAPCPPIYAACVIEDLQNTAETPDYGGEYAEGWLDDVTLEEQEQLTALLTETFEKWARKHGHLPTWQGLTQKDKYAYTKGRVVLISKEADQWAKDKTHT